MAFRKLRQSILKITSIQQELSGLIEEKLSSLGLPENPFSLYEPVRYTLSLGGKRVRPYFALTGCGLCGGDIEEAVPAAIAIELLHNFTLLHDDIMDGAATRRGKPSVYRKWNASTAILSGDAMYAWAFDQLQYYGRDDRYTKSQYAAILDIFLESARLVCEGQAYDLEFESRSTVTVDDYLQMIRGKTAALISGAFRLGGAVAGTSEARLGELHELGTEVGIAFQIQDDLLDIIADPEKFGKKQGGDILEGKKTYLSILSLQHGSAAQRSFLEEIFHKTDVSEEEVEEVISLYQSLGIIRQASEAVKKHYELAVSHLDNLDDSPYKEDLIEFLTMLINREY